MALADVRSSRAHKVIRKQVALVGIAHAQRLAHSGAVGQTVTLTDVEHGILAKHRHEPTFRVLTISILHLQLLDKDNLRAVLAFSHIAAGF